MEQGTPEWFQARCGLITMSHASDVLAKGKGVTRRNYFALKLKERLTGVPVIETYSNQHMENGTEQEAFAREQYVAERKVDVVQVGFTVHPDRPYMGASSDGLVGDDGMVEIKCPTDGVFLDFYETRKISNTYLLQMIGQMIVEDRQWCDFTVYNGTWPEWMRLLVVRIERKDFAALEESLLAECELFNQELNVKIEAMHKAAGIK